MKNLNIAHHIAKLTGGNTTNSSSEFEMDNEDIDDYEGGDGQQSQSSEILRQKLESLPQGRIDVASRVGTEAPARDYRSTSKKKLKKDPGRFLMKKMKAEEEFHGMKDTGVIEPI